MNAPNEMNVGHDCVSNGMKAYNETNMNPTNGTNAPNEINMGHNGMNRGCQTCLAFNSKKNKPKLLLTNLSE